MYVSRRGSKVLGDPGYPSGGVSIRELRIEAVLSEEVICGLPVILGPDSGFGSNKTPKDLLVRAAPVILHLRSKRRRSPPLYRLVRLQYLSVHVTIPVVVSREPERARLVANTWVEAPPPLPVGGDPERLDLMHLRVVVDEDLPREDVVGAHDETVVPVLR